MLYLKLILCFTSDRLNLHAGAVQNVSPATGWACRNSVCWISWCCASPATGWTCKKMVCRITRCFRHNHQRHAGLSWIHINERGAVHAYYLYLKIYWCRNANINDLESLSFFLKLRNDFYNSLSLFAILTISSLSLFSLMVSWTGKQTSKLLTISSLSLLAMSTIFACERYWDRYPGSPPSRVAQWKRAGPIAQRSVDRNHALLPCERLE